MLSGFTHQLTIPATANTAEITELVLHIFREHWEFFLLRRVGISWSKLVNQTSSQLSLFEEPEKQIRNEKLDYLCDEIRKRYGFKALIHASSLLYGATAISRISKVGGH